MFPDSSGHEGTASAFKRIVTASGNPPTAVYDRNYGAVLGPGVVDANIPTRQQYVLPDAFQPLFGAAAGLAFTQADIDANPGKVLAASMFVAPASAFAAGVVPTPSQIRNAAIWVGRSATVSAAGNLDATMNAIDMLNQTLAPNTKYWLMACPTAVVSGSTPSIANDVPMGDVNALGRGISLWSNRTPLAPIITSPTGSVSTFAGREVILTYSPQDPDAVTSFPGDLGPNDFDDVAGIQFQYAARTTDGSEPVWADLPISDLTGLVYGEGWHLDDTTNPNTEGAYYAWVSRKLVIQCGVRSGFTAASAFLPAGDWLVRLRTFDYGHGRPDSTDRLTVPPTGPPLGDYTHSYTPATYPAVNTSPWSTPLRIFITPQVPAPISISPVDNIAVIDGAAVNLSWRYRNTYSPPYAQAIRTVQIRRGDETEWTTLVNDEASTSSSLLVSGYPLVSGNQYAWRVKVVDESGVESDYSETAYFWMVPAPSSGAVIPDPSELIDGGTLGCGTHRVEVYRRGGKVRVGEIRGIELVEWNRLRDDISDARVVVKGWDVDCGNLLSLLRAWAYEIVIFRDNGQDVDRVWEGPITLLTYEDDKVTIQAKDVLAYAYRRIIKQPVIDSGDSPTAGRSVVARTAAILQNVFAPDDPNVLAYLNVISNTNDAKQYRSVPAYSRTAYEEIDDMAANAGLDYTAVGRSVVVWGTKNRTGLLPEFRDKDLGNSPIVSEYGMSMSNRYVVSDGNGVWGEATRLDVNGEDLDYGLVEMLSSTWASDSTEETGTFTEAGVTEVRESFSESAERSIESRYPAPVVVRIPDNTQINPDTVISIRQLVPGVAIPLHSVNTLREIRATQKLDSVKVIEEKGTEKITITLSPFSRQDNQLEEGA